MEITIQKKYIISQNTIFGFRKDKELFLIIKNASKRNLDNDSFSCIDFSRSVGFLPSSSNKYGERNAEKWFIVDKKKPKESYSYDIWCIRYRWAGRGKSKPYYDLVSVEKERYHRDYFEPYEVYFYYDKENDRFVSDGIVYNDSLFPKIKNTINLLLKVFGECTISDNDDSYLGKTEVEKWVFLPSGTWSKDKETIANHIGKCKKDFRENLEHDLEILYGLKPDGVAIGADGFNGYFAFKYNSKGICVLESKHILNATYIFDIDLWADLSKKTKTEIIESHSAKDRIFHKRDWESRLNNYFK